MPDARPQPREVRTLQTDQQLCTLRYSPCGRVLAAGGFDGTVRRWDVYTSLVSELPPLGASGGWMQALAFHPDGRRLFTADSWGRLTAWNWADDDPRPAWSVAAAHDGWIRGLALGGDGLRLATCGLDRAVRVWSADDGRKLGEFAGHADDVFCVAFHPAGQGLVSGDLRGRIKHWDLASGKHLRDLDAALLYKTDRLQDVGGVRVLRFTPDGQTLLAAGMQPSSGGNVQGTPAILWFDFHSGQTRHQHLVGRNGDGFVYDLQWHADGYAIAVASGNPGSGKLFFLRPDDKEPFYLSTKMANCHALAVHPDGRRLAVAATNTGSNGNGRQLRNGEYPANFSPIYLLEIPA